MEVETNARHLSICGPEREVVGKEREREEGERERGKYIGSRRGRGSLKGWLGKGKRGKKGNWNSKEGMDLKRNA